MNYALVVMCVSAVLGAIFLVYMMRSDQREERKRRADRERRLDEEHRRQVRADAKKRMVPDTKTVTYDVSTDPPRVLATKMSYKMVDTVTEAAETAEDVADAVSLLRHHHHHPHHHDSTPSVHHCIDTSSHHHSHSTHDYDTSRHSHDSGSDCGFFDSGSSDSGSSWD